MQVMRVAGLVMKGTVVLGTVVSRVARRRCELWDLAKSVERGENHSSCLAGAGIGSNESPGFLPPVLPPAPTTGESWTSLTPEGRHKSWIDLVPCFYVKVAPLSMSAPSNPQLSTSVLARPSLVRKPFSVSLRPFFPSGKTGYPIEIDFDSAGLYLYFFRCLGQSIF
jgi:hypothetical protein